MLQPTSALSPGALAPPFDLPLLGGGMTSLAELRRDGRPALLIFFKVECPTCKLAAPILERIWKRVKAADGRAGFLTVAQNVAGDLPPFLEKYRATFPVALDLDPYPVSDAYGITNVPTLFLLDEHGVVVKNGVGFSRPNFDALSDDLLSRAAGETGSLFTPADTGLPVLQPG